MNKKETKRDPGKRNQGRTPVSHITSKQGTAGELHQLAVGEHPALTTNQGAAISDDQNSLRAGYTLN